MKDIEKLKSEQQELKEKLLKLINFINSDEFYKLQYMEQMLLNQQRMGMEVYLNALTKRIYNPNSISDNTGMIYPLLLSMMGMPALGNQIDIGKDDRYSIPKDAFKTTGVNKTAIFE